MNMAWVTISIDEETKELLKKKKENKSYKECIRNLIDKDFKQDTILTLIKSVEDMDKRLKDLERIANPY